MIENRDVVVVGGGMVGMSLALLLRSRLSETIGVTLLEGNSLPVEVPRDDAYPAFDARVTALSYGSRRIYESIGIWRDLEVQASPINSIHVSSKGRFGSTVLESSVYGWSALGYVVENQTLGTVLLSAIQKSKGIELEGSSRVLEVKSKPGSCTNLKVFTEGSSRQLTSKLLVVADGAKSKLREAFSIGSTVKTYGYEAIVANVGFEQRHANCAYERFAGTGPLAILPLLGSASHPNRCGLVWSVNEDKALMFEKSSSFKFKELLQKEFGYRLGRVTHVGERSRFPLELVRSNEQVRQGVVIMGNAAHSLHPVAGQGFNLALRDADVLSTELLRATSQNLSLGDLRVLEAYQLARMRDQEITIDASDILPRLFTNENPVISTSRCAALSALDILPLVKTKLVRQAAGMFV